MPYFFAGKLESGNVCEYFVMMHYFHSLGIREHDAILYEMGMKEKDHEIYFLNQIRTSRLLPFFEKVFSWGSKSSLNDVDIENRYSVRKIAGVLQVIQGAATGKADILWPTCLNSVHFAIPVLSFRPSE